MRKILFVMMAILPLLAAAQEEDASVAKGNDRGLWFSAETSKSFGKRWSFDTELNVRTSDHLKTVNRYSLGVSATYRPLRWLRLGAGVDFMNDYKFGKTTLDYKREDPTKFNGYNIDSDYWRPRQRYHFDVVGRLKWNRFTFSLRERYQYTHYMPAAYKREKYRDPSLQNPVISQHPDCVQLGGVPQEFIQEMLDNGDIVYREGQYYDSEDWRKYEKVLDKDYRQHPDGMYYEVENAVKEKSAKDSHILRSRLSVEYNIPRIPLVPSVSYEVQNNLCDAMKLLKHRVTVGLEWKVTKVFSLEGDYIYQHETEFDDTTTGNLHVFNLGAKFKF